MSFSFFVVSVCHFVFHLFFAALQQFSRSPSNTLFVVFLH